jgi:hypothetical protein
MLGGRVEELQTILLSLPHCGVLPSVEGSEVITPMVRNRHGIARLGPTPARQTALEAMSDLFGCLPEAAAAGWVDEARDGACGTRGGTLDELSNPWDT